MLIAPACLAILTWRWGRSPLDPSGGTNWRVNMAGIPFSTAFYLTCDSLLCCCQSLFSYRYTFLPFTLEHLYCAWYCFFITLHFFIIFILLSRDCLYRHPSCFLPSLTPPPGLYIHLAIGPGWFIYVPMYLTIYFLRLLCYVSND